MLSGGLIIVFARYCETWRRMRRAAHEELNKAECLKFLPVQTAEAVQLTYDLIMNPEKWDSHLRRAAASSIMSAVYDLPTLKSEDDPAIHRINDFVERLVRAALPGAHFVEFFPWMRYLPTWIAKWKRDALDWYKKDSVLFEGMYDDVKHRLSEGDERPSFCSSLINGTEKYGLTNRESAWLATAMFAAGAETTSAVMAWFITAMAAHPEVQKRAHEELDAIVGRSRMPVSSDFPNLPYIRAIVKEVLRWRPVGPIGLPHRSVADDWYKGYLIPGDTIVIANIWAINRDRNVYGQDADQFNPARFLNEDGSLKSSIPDTKDEGHTTFGFGRRCETGIFVEFKQTDSAS
ncbi:hypothetical protein C0992_001272 [Termitomyces sp. T32_za158]|nr:hypothetical protein C0992_001272 [Termitomyces sp. T32_za158]